MESIENFLTLAEAFLVVHTCRAGRRRGYVGLLLVMSSSANAVHYLPR